MKLKSVKFIFIFTLTTAIILPSNFALASETNGTIDPTYKYAWSENTGWLNFGATEGNVHITDSALTGYAWAENIGWISLNCSNDNSCGTVDYKVSNDGEGNLSGYAWSENTGWVNFNPTYGGVTINSSGEFLGYAWGENIGWIVFNCATTNSCATVDYKVKTDWRPQSARPACNNAIDDDGDGKTDYPNDPGCSSLEDNDETDSSGNGGNGGGGGGGGGGYYIPPDTTAPIILHPDGTLVKTADNEDVYLIEEGKKRHISNLEIFNSWGYNWDDIIIITQQEMDAYLLGEPVSMEDRVCAGADFNFDNKVDLVDFGTLIHSWGSETPSNPCVDINADGIVDLIDCGTLIFQWTG